MDPMLMEEGSSPQLKLLKAQIAALQSEYNRLQNQAAVNEPQECNTGCCPLPEFRNARDEAILDLTSSVREKSSLSGGVIELTQEVRAVGGNIDKETLKAMLRREHMLRRSPDTQRQYAEAEEKEDTDWMDVTIELQKQVWS